MQLNLNSTGSHLEKDLIDVREPFWKFLVRLFFASNYLYDHVNFTVWLKNGHTHVLHGSDIKQCLFVLFKLRVNGRLPVQLNLVYVPLFQYSLLQVKSARVWSIVQCFARKKEDLAWLTINVLFYSLQQELVDNKEVIFAANKLQDLLELLHSSNITIVVVVNYYFVSRVDGWLFLLGRSSGTVRRLLNIRHRRIHYVVDIDAVSFKFLRI